MKRLAALPVILLLLLAGCTNESPSAPSAGDETVATPGTVAPEEATTTPAQWASVIAVEKERWDEWYEDWDGECDFIVANTEGGIICRMQLVSATIMPLTSVTNIGGMTDPDGLKQLADTPPPEIADLYTDTLGGAETLETLAADWSDADCNVEVKEECIALGREFEYGINNLRDQFTAWSPYL